jgi:hypothetical protein
VRLRSLTLDALTVDDEKSLRHIGLYGELKEVLRRDGVRFFVAPAGSPQAFWDRALFLNQTFWSATEPSDVLMDEHIPADVVAHAAWHHLAGRALVSPAGDPSSPPTLSAAAMLLAESIASAFDLYLVGRLLGHSPDADFLVTQVPAMAEVAADAGLSQDRFEELLQTTAADPDRAFEDLRELLFDTAMALLPASGVQEAAEILTRTDGHRFAPLLHHYDLSNWILYARAYAPRARQVDPLAQAVDAALRTAPAALDWLEANWVLCKDHSKTSSVL